MPMFFTLLAKKYNPYDIDNGMFAMNCAAPRSLPIVCTKMIADDGYGTATVNGKLVSKGKCVKFDFSPLPIYLLPVGEAAQDFDKTYTVKLSGYRDIDGRRFPDCTFRFKTPPKPIDDGLHKKNEQAAKEVSDEGIVLLENNGILPLGSGSSIKLLGAYNDFRITAIGASLIKPRWTLTVPEAVEHSGALSIRDNAETALFFISRGSGENKDNRPIKGEYYLTDEEKAALSEAAAKYKNLIIILNIGYPIEMGFIRGLGASAVIWTGFSGQRGSESLIDILCGKVNPSGKLADTWPIDYYDSPSAKTSSISMTTLRSTPTTESASVQAYITRNRNLSATATLTRSKKTPLITSVADCLIPTFPSAPPHHLKAAYSASAQKSQITPMFPERTLFSSMSKHRAGMNRDPQSCSAALKRQHF